MNKKWSEHMRFNCKNGKIMIANTFTGQVLIVSEECLSYIEHFLMSGLKENKFLSIFEDEDDKIYIMSLITKLKEIHAFSDDPFYGNIYNNLEITWSLTNRCNLKCIHCCVSANEQEQDISMSKLINIADKIVSVKPSHIIITGGEPLMLTEFTEIIRYIKEKYNGPLILLTNGLLIDEKMADFIKYNFSSVSISLDGYDDESSSMIRGCNVFSRAVSSIQLLQTKGMKDISASMVVTAFTNDKINFFTELCEKLNVIPLLRGLEQIGRGKENKDDLLIKPLKRMEESHDETRRFEPHIFTCKGAFLTFHINHKGFVLPCSVVSDERFQMGNILKIVKFDDFIFNKSYIDTQGYRLFDSFKPYNIKQCEGCYKNLMCFNCVCDVLNAIENNFDHTCLNTGNCFDYCWEI